MNVDLLGMIDSKPTKSPKEMNPAQLAYVGDAVFELYVRYYLLAQGIVRPQQLQKQATRYVSAKSQAESYRNIETMLTDEEVQIVKRGRNAKTGQVPKNASVSDYRWSTGLEALIGYIYLSSDQTRLEKIMSEILQAEFHEK